MEGRHSNKLYCAKPQFKSAPMTDMFYITYPENDPRTVCITSNTKNPDEIGGLGNPQTTRAPISTNPRRGQNAHIQGSNGRSPRDQRAAKYPPRIWNGKSMSTATARSSLPRPFSTILRLVAASCAAQPTLANRCIKREDWTSRAGQKAMELTVTKEPTFELHDVPNRLVDTCDARVLALEDFLSLRNLVGQLRGLGQENIPTSFWKNASQMVTQKHTTLQKRR